MRKLIKSPAPELSQLKEFNIDLDMNGKHYALLATSEGQIPEDVALSILRDLMEEDANKLTIAELRYLFIMVKINSLENDYKVKIGCTHTLKNNKTCGHVNTYSINLSDADLNRTPKNYKVPAIFFTIDKTEKEYKVMPPTMDMESALLNYYIVDKGYSQQDIVDNKEVALQYTFTRSCMHLVDKDGERLIKQVSDFDVALTYMEQNKFQTITELYKLVKEVNSYGVQNKVYEFKCKECGGTLVFQLPLLHGLAY